MLNRFPNAQYNVAAPESLPVRIAASQRRKMYELALSRAAIQQDDTILDVGVTSDQTYASSNYIEAWYPHRNRITACGIDDASFLERLYPGMRFVQANGLNLPFEGGSFDVVHASAVLEHVGSFENQIRFISECARVARRAFFLTTPNGRFPVEFHTVLPLVHWLPKPIFRAVLRHAGLAFFAEEANLNLMTRRELATAMASSQEAADFDWHVESVHLWGWPSNLLAIGLRASPVQGSKIEKRFSVFGTCSPQARGPDATQDHAATS
jgi:hypothetical protein